jgi:hypothetical protein
VVHGDSVAKLLNKIVADIAIPIMYCESDENAIHVLEKNMDNGQLPKAPIRNDTACPFENETTSLRVCFIIFLSVLRIT